VPERRLDGHFKATRPRLGVFLRDRDPIRNYHEPTQWQSSQLGGGLVAVISPAMNAVDIIPGMN